MKNEELFEQAIVEMGRRVGLDWSSIDDAVSYQNENGSDRWYTTKTWTKDDENEFKIWMKDLLKKNTMWSRHKINFEVGMFILSYGWKVEHE